MTIDVRERIQAEIFDYQTLTDALGELSFPRDKITDLIRKRIIIRIKKGLYVFGDRYRRHPYSRELLANLIYGPSYVSLDYALDFYGFIPERSEALTSVTLGRSRKFHTPVGLFIYRQIPIHAYQAGMVRVEGDHGQAFLIASPEKALADKIISERGVPIASPTGMRQFLVESLRIDVSTIQSLSVEKIEEYSGLYHSRKLRQLSRLVERSENPKGGLPMNEAICQILAKYEIRSLDDSIRALREIMQEIALLGLWRSKFFEKAAFYGGTALRVLYGLDRFSEDLDFSLLERNEDFDLAIYGDALKRELSAFGFDVEIESRKKTTGTAIQSTFLKANTRYQMITVEFDKGLIQQVPRNQKLKIKLEIDTDPPSGFSTANRYILLPVPFAVRAFSLPDLFAGKMHAVLCREWKSRVKGRDWYDFVWFAANHPEMHLSHLEQRMLQTGHWKGPSTFTPEDFHTLLTRRIIHINIDQTRREVEPFVKDAASLALWSREFFLDVAARIKIV